VPGYIGFDATAPSLHVGSLVQIMLLRRLQQAGRCGSPARWPAGSSGEHRSAVQRPSRAA
jgi:hypothetical protein